MDDLQLGKADYIDASAIAVPIPLLDTTHELASRTPRVRLSGLP